MYKPILMNFGTDIDGSMESVIGYFDPSEVTGKN